MIIKIDGNLNSLLSMIKTPEFLKNGDKVGIIAPARSVTPEKIEITEQVLVSWGLKSKRSKNLLGKFFQFSGTIVERISDLQEMMDDAEIKAIICAGGGYGAIQLVSNLDYSLLIKNPKWLVGFSDITLLHAAFQNKAKLAGIHGIMPVKFDNNPEAQISLDTLRMALFGELKEYKAKSDKNSVPGSSNGILIGGNLSILYSLLGTPYDIGFSDKILFIEEVDEYLYHIERMIYSFKLSGKLKQLKGLIVGNFSKIHDNDIPFGKDEKEIILDAVKEYNFPVIFDFPAGHEDLNQALYLGRMIELEVNIENYLIRYI